jgi:hypothetical protein
MYGPHSIQARDGEVLELGSHAARARTTHAHTHKDQYQSPASGGAYMATEGYRMRQLQAAIATRLRRGDTPETIERQLIAPFRLPEEQQSVLCPYAWSLLKHGRPRPAPPARAGSCSDARPGSGMSAKQLRFLGELQLEVAARDGGDELAAPDGQPPANAVIAERVESRAGTGLAGLTVAVVDRGATAGEELAAQAQTDGNGDFRLVLAGLGALLVITVAFRVLDEHQDVLVDDVLDVGLNAGEGRVRLMVPLEETEVPPRCW